MEQIKEGYTRVSNILSIFQAYSHVPKDKLKRAQDTGTVVHHSIEKYFRGEFDPVSSKNFTYISSFLKWVSAADPIPFLFEHRFYDHSLMITGRIDLLATINGETALVDFKTGSWAHPEIWYLQGCFYRYLLQQNNAGSPSKFLFVNLKKDGSDPTLYEFTYAEKDWDLCIAATDMYKYFLNHR